MKSVKRQVSVAPMMGWTDTHFRNLIRIISRHTLLYTEMITTGALIHGDQHRFLTFDPAEHPLALQLGGSDPQELATCVKLAQSYGYDEVNLNVGCPSDRVQKGRIGACLMKDPDLVRSCCKAMLDVADIPITVKCRIGVDDYDSYPYFQDFINTVASSGVEVFIIHARKAWLNGLSPKENRHVPPLCYKTVLQLKHDFPWLNIVINGGLTDVHQSLQTFSDLDGVMIGRAAYHDPYCLAGVDQQVFGAPRQLTRAEIVTQYAAYAARIPHARENCTALIRHCLGLYHGAPGAKTWRRFLSQFNQRHPATPQDIINALSLLENCTPCSSNT